MKRIKNSSLKRQIYLRCKIILRKYSNELSIFLKTFCKKETISYCILSAYRSLLCLKMFFSFVYIKREESNRIKVEEEYRVRLDSISLEIDKRDADTRKRILETMLIVLKYRVYEL